MERKKKAVLSIHETATFRGFPEFGLRRLIRDGDIPTIKIGNRNYINQEVFEDFLKKGNHNAKK